MKRDLGKYARQTRFQLIVGGLVLFFIIGEGLIYWLYGSSGAMSGLICMGVGLIPVALVIILLQVMDWIVKKANQDK